MWLFVLNETFLFLCIILLTVNVCPCVVVRDGCAGWLCRMVVQDGCAGWLCRMVVQDGCAG